MPESAPALPGHENCIGGGFDRPATPKAMVRRESEAAAGRLPGSEDIAGVEDAASQSAASDVASGRSFLLFLQLLLLLSCQKQQLNIGRQYLAHGILELPPGGHPAPDLLGPLRGNTIRVSLPVDHVRQGPSGVPLAADTATAGLSAARITQGQGSRELIRQWRQITNDFKLALAQARGV